MSEFEGWYTTIEACTVLNRSEGWLRLNCEKYAIERKLVGKGAYYRVDDVNRVAVQIGTRKEA